MNKFDSVLVVFALLVSGAAIGGLLNEYDPAPVRHNQTATISPNYNLLVDTTAGETFVVDYNMQERECRASMQTLAIIMQGNNNKVSCEAYENGEWKEIIYP